MGYDPHHPYDHQPSDPVLQAFQSNAPSHLITESLEVNEEIENNDSFHQDKIPPIESEKDLSTRLRNDDDYLEERIALLDLQAIKSNTVYASEDIKAAITLMVMVCIVLFVVVFEIISNTGNVYEVVNV